MNQRTIVTPLECQSGSAAAHFDCPDGEFTVNVSANVELAGDATAWLPPAIFLSMKTCTPLYVSGPLDEQIWRNAKDAQHVINSWWPHSMQTVDVDSASKATPTPGHDRGVGCFFSGGLDSFYSAVKNSPAITHLIFVHGFDIFLNSHSKRHYDKTIFEIRHAAATMGKQLIEVRTDLRTKFHRLGRWDVGYGLAHVALLLSEHLHTVYIPASAHCGDAPPRATHHELDYLWSSGAVQIIHDGLEADRVQKAETVKSSPAAMESIRVCFWNRADRLNCGECEKCVRTAINLRIAGALPLCTALPPINPIRALTRIPADDPSTVYFLKENLGALQNSDRDDPELESALESALHRSALQKATARSWYIFTVVKVLGLTLREKAYQAIIARRGDTD